MRVFVAFDLSIPTVENLVLLQEDLQKPLAQLGLKTRWIDAPNIHLTLKFIGDVEDNLVLHVRERLADVAHRHLLFETETSGTGCFPDYRKPRILWAGTGGDEGPIQALRDHLEGTLAELGIEPERRAFHPHVTIGRIRTQTKRVDVGPTLTPYRDTVFGTTQVKDFALYQSQLGPRGVTYRVIERYPLGL